MFDVDRDVVLPTGDALVLFDRLCARDSGVIGTRLSDGQSRTRATGETGTRINGEDVDAAQAEDKQQQADDDQEHTTDVLHGNLLEIGVVRLTTRKTK